MDKHTVKPPIHAPSVYYTVSQKRGVELFATTSLTVNRFWKFFHCWKQQ